MLTELYPVRVISAQRMHALIATFSNAVLSIRLVGGAEHVPPPLLTCSKQWIVLMQFAVQGRRRWANLIHLTSDAGGSESISDMNNMNPCSQRVFFFCIFITDNAVARLLWILHWYKAPKEGTSDLIFEVLAFKTGRHWQENDVWKYRKLYNVE